MCRHKARIVPGKMRKVLDTVRPNKMVLAHTGGMMQWEQVYELLAGEEVYMDLSSTFPYVEREILLKIMEKHDKNKLLFASDSPWSNPSDDLDAVRSLPLTNAEIEAILSGNASRLLGIV